MKENHNKYLLQSTLYSTANMMIAGSVIQAFLLESGVAESIVTWYLSLVQIIQVSVMMCLSLVIDRIKKIVKAYAFSMLIQSVVFFSLIFLCIFQGVPVTTKYILVFSTGIITNVALAAHNVFTYKAPYHIIDMSDYARFTGIIGVVIGIGCIVVSAAMSFFTARFPYYPTMLCFFVFGVAVLLISFFLACSYKVVEEVQSLVPHEEKKPKKKVSLFRYRPFYLLFLPNLCRGFCAGILTVAMTIGYIEGITTPASGAVLTLLLQIGNVASSLLFTLMVKRVTCGSMTLVSSLLLLFFMPAMLLQPDLTLFYVMYFFANFILNIINNAVPVAVIKFVDYDYVGQYSSWRMLLHTAGVAVASVLVTPMMALFGGAGTLGIAALLQVISGVSYFVFLKNVERRKA